MKRRLAECAGIHYNNSINVCYILLIWSSIPCENTSFHSVRSVIMALFTPVPKTAIAREIPFFHPIRYCVRAQIATQTDGSHLHLNQLPFHRQMVFESDKGVEKTLGETDQSSAA